MRLSRVSRTLQLRPAKSAGLRSGCLWAELLRIEEVLMAEPNSYQAPPHGWRTFLIVWATQSVSVLGSALTFFATTIWLTLTLYPRPEQKPELAFALSM